jgi:hypothetical protein
MTQEELVLRIKEFPKEIIDKLSIGLSWLPVDALKENSASDILASADQAKAELLEKKEVAK